MTVDEYSVSVPRSRNRPTAMDSRSVPSKLPAAGKKLSSIGLLLGLWICTFTAEIRAQDESSTSAETVRGLTVLEAATYQARWNGEDFVDGRFEATVAWKGEPALLDWSPVRIALRDLAWLDGRPAIWGAFPDGRQAVMVESDDRRLTGHWSAHGDVHGESAEFRLVFPRAMHSTLKLDLPAGQILTSTSGIVTPPRLDESGTSGFWRVDLGRDSAARISIKPALREIPSNSCVYEEDAVLVLREDGVFVQIDYRFDRLGSSVNHLQFIVPRTLTVQSMSSSGLSLSYARTEESPERVTIPLTGSDEKFPVRLQAFQPLNWGQRRGLPTVRVNPARAVQQKVAIRVEHPLRIISVAPQGFLQTALSVHDGQEIWRFESIQPEPDGQPDLDNLGVASSRPNVEGPRLFVDAYLPRPKLNSKIDCVADLRAPTGRLAADLEIQSDVGSAFEVLLDIPDTVDVVEVSPLDADSQLAEWKFSSGRLQLVFQHPIGTSAAKMVRIRGLVQAIDPSHPATLPILHVRGASQATARMHVALPREMDLQILEGDAWRVSRISDVVSVDVENVLGTHEFASETLNLVEITSDDVGRAPPSIQLTRHFALEAVHDVVSDHNPAPIFENESAEASPTIARESQQASAALFRLSTVVGPAASTQLLHFAHITFDRPTPSDSLQLRLPSACRLSALALDGRTVTVVRQDDQILIPQDDVRVEEVELTFLTDRVPVGLVRKESIPLPVLGIPVLDFEWTLELPPEEELWSTRLGDGRSAQAPTESLFRSLGGPLTRSSQLDVFDPFSRQTWRDLGGTGATAGAGLTKREEIVIRSPGATDRVEFQTLNRAVLGGYSWICFFGALLIGIGGRMLRFRYFRRSTLLWLVCLVVAICFVPSQWSTVIGGAFLGTLLSVAMPRPAVRPTDFLAARNALTILVAASAVGGQATHARAQEPPRARSELRGTLPMSSPDYLIESAQYRLVSEDPHPSFHAEFAVTLLNDESPEVLVELPFQGVVFPRGASCHVDGEPHDLIPATGHGGVVVRLPKTVLALGQDDAKTEPIRRTQTRIEIDFTVQPDVDANEAQEALWSVSIPPVTDSRLTVPKSSELQFRHWGAAETATGETSIELGGLGSLALLSPDRQGISPDHLVVASSIEVTPLGGRVSTRIQISRAPRNRPPENFPSGGSECESCRRSLYRRVVDHTQRQRGGSLWPFKWQRRPRATRSIWNSRFHSSGIRRTPFDCLRLISFPARRSRTTSGSRSLRDSRCRCRRILRAGPCLSKNGTNSVCPFAVDHR